uniref:Uncharacterized protein n=1 Tax=Arundo donax TaxID=35708 RepID=A0A0A9CG45_ARUDO
MFCFTLSSSSLLRADSISIAPKLANCIASSKHLPNPAARARDPHNLAPPSPAAAGRATRASGLHRQRWPT